MYDILIVDDELHILNGLEAKIRRCDISDIDRIHKAKDVSEAIDILRHNKIHILITDIEMPDLSGLDLIHAIGGIDYDIVKVVISGFDNFSYVKGAFIDGAVDYLLKPVSIEILKKTLDDCIEKITAANRKSDAEHIEYCNAVGTKMQEHINGLTESSGDASIESMYQTFTNDVIYESFQFVAVVPVGKADIQDIIKCIYSKRRDSDRKIHYYIDIHKVLYLLVNGNTQAVEKFPRYLLDIYAKCNVEAYLFVSGVKSIKDSIMETYDCLERARHKKILVESNTIIRDFVTGQSNHNNMSYYIELFSEQTKVSVSISDTIRFRTLIDNIFNINNAVKYGVDFLYIMYNRVMNIISTQYNNRGSYDPYDKFNNMQEMKEAIIKYLHDNIDKNKKPDIVEFTKKYIKENMNKKINMAYIANCFNMNYSNFSREFTKQTGMNFSKFVVMEKMDHAKYVIETTSKRIADISDELGYINSKNFTRVFRQTFGCSPSEYKNSLI